MSKIAIIDSCHKCPHFFDSTPFNHEQCTKLGRILTKKDYNISYIIPSDCPLKDAALKDAE